MAGLSPSSSYGQPRTTASSTALGGQRYNDRQPSTPPPGYPPGSTYNPIVGKWMLPAPVPKTQEQIDAAAREENDRTRNLEYERREVQGREDAAQFDRDRANREFQMAERTDNRRYRLARRGQRQSAALAALLQQGGDGAPLPPAADGAGAGGAGGAGGPLTPGVLPDGVVDKGRTGPPGGGGSGVPSAQDAGYARLKEREGLRLRSGINATKSAMGRRGLSGSSFESPAIAALVGGSNATLADFDASALADSVGRGREVEDRDFAARERRDTSRMDALLRLIQSGSPAY